MTPKRAHYLMIGLICLLVVVFFGAAYGISTMLAHQSNSLVSLKAKLGGLNQEQTNLNQAKKDIATYNDLYDIAKVVVPENKDQAEAVRQIVNLASESNVTLSTITFPSSSLGNTSTSTSGATTTPAPVASSSSSGSAALSQLTPVPQIAGVYELPITIQSSSQKSGEATYPELIKFLSALEQNRQTALVSSINITPDQDNQGYFSFSLLLDIYIKPGA